MPIADIPNHTHAESAIVWAMNVERRRHGLRSLRARRGLARVAFRHSVDQLRHDRMQHASFDGTTIVQRIRRGGNYRSVGEVLAWVPDGLSRRARRVVQLWMESPSHRAQVLQPRYRFVGVGRKHGAMGGQRGVIFTADFGGR